MNIQEIGLKDIGEINLGKPFYVEQVTPTTVRVVDVNGTPRLEGLLHRHGDDK
jgi:hypothetical protein